VCIAVVWLMYAANLADAPRLADDIPTLEAMTGLFAVLACVGAASLFGLLRRWRGHLLLFLFFLVSLAPGGWLLRALVS